MKTKIALAIAVLAVAGTATALARAAGPWRLVSKSGARNMIAPSASINFEDVYPGLEYQVATQSTLPANKLTWEATCRVYYGSSDTSGSEVATHGNAFPGKGKHTFAITLPKTPATATLVHYPNGTVEVQETNLDVSCHADVNLDASGFKRGTVGLWLTERDPTA